MTRAITEITHNGAISRYLAIFTVTALVLGWIAYSGSGLSAPTRELLPVAPVIAVGWLMLIVATVSVVTMHHHRFRALVLIGIIGLSISAGFAYLSAPDLALTQISVETVTIMLLLLALHFMPKVTPKESSHGPEAPRRCDRARCRRRGRRAGLRVPDARYRDDLGLPHRQQLRGRWRHERGQRHPRGLPRLRYLRRDHRAGDRGLMIYALMHALLDGPAARRLKKADYAQDRSRDRHPLMMVVVTRVLMPIAIVVGLYIFLRGHNEPGGGFVAGLVIAIALLMQYMASGFAWTQERKRIEYHTMIGLGVVIAG
jgi:multicomponent K+:H+ antiporter subunit A